MDEFKKDKRIIRDIERIIVHEWHRLCFSGKKLCFICHV